MHALGRGLDSLIAGGSPEALEVGSRILAITKIRPNPNQPRKTFDSTHLEELRDSIRLHGVLQPICVRQIDGGYEIVSGERRWRASRLAGLAEIPVVILEGVDDNRLLELAMVENLQRQDLDPMEKARGFEELMQQVGMTQAQVAERVGLKRSTVANHLRLLDLGEDAQDALVSGLISMGHARALAGLNDDVLLQKALAAVVRDELSVRQTEQLVRTPDASPASASDEPTPKVDPQAPWAKDFEKRIREALGVQVDLKNGKAYKGQITLKYGDRDQLEAIVELLAPKSQLE
ncbi:MAG: ParB family chromosome partitioning protein [Planctomycetota bacterium]|jgi:ParB family chromosome partitioning protein